MKIKVNLTPTHLLCTYGACPAVYELEDGTLAVIGNRSDDQQIPELKGKVAEHEDVILIDTKYFAEFVKKHQ